MLFHQEFNTNQTNSNKYLRIFKMLISNNIWFENIFFFLKKKLFLSLHIINTND